jgi:hypothetical protein
VFPRASAILAIVSTPTELRDVSRKCIVGREMPERSESLLRVTPSWAARSQRLERRRKHERAFDR